MIEPSFSTSNLKLSFSSVKRVTDLVSAVLEEGVVTVTVASPTLYQFQV
jgi:hypothetical protein